MRVKSKVCVFEMDFENVVKMLLPLIESQHLKPQKQRKSQEHSAIYKQN